MRALVDQHLHESRTGIIAPVVQAMFAVERPADAISLPMRGIEAGDIRAHSLYADHLTCEGRHETALRHYLVALVDGSEDAHDKIIRTLTITKNGAALKDLTTYGVTTDCHISPPWHLGT